jgi:hypothetical protein
VQLRVAAPAATKQIRYRYVALVGQASGREVEAREIAVEMLEQFMATDRDFGQWRRLAQTSVFESHESRIHESLR